MNQRKFRLILSGFSIKNGSYIRLAGGFGTFLLLLLFLIIPFVLIMTASNRLLSLFYDKTTLREGIIGQPVSFNPLFSYTNTTDKTLTKLLFRGVTKMSIDGKWHPDLAEDISVSEDGLIYTIKLSDSLYWDDGYRLTTEDVLFTYAQIQSPDYFGYWREAFKGVKFEKKDDLILILTLEEPLSSFYNSLTVGILPKHVLGNVSVRDMEKSDFNLSPIGNGRFSVENSSVTENGGGKSNYTISLLNNNKEAKIRHVQFRYYENIESIMLAYKNGEIDSFRYTIPKDIDLLTAWNNYTLHNVPIAYRSYQIYFKTDLEGPISNKNVRNALSLSLDRKQLVANIFNNHASASYGPIEETSWAYSKDDVVSNYDPEEARRLLSESDNANLNLTLTAPDTYPSREVFEYVKEQWAQIGITLELRLVEPENFERDVIRTRDFQLCFFGQETSLDPDRYPLWHSTQIKYPGLNISGISSKRIDKSLEVGRQTYDENKRKEQYIDFQKYFIEEMPSIYLYHPSYDYLVRNRVKGVKLENLGLPENRFDSIDEWYL